MTPQELAQLAVETKPAEFADGLLYEDQIVFEVDPKLKNDGNPLGLGDGFGKVVGGVLDSKIDIEWAGEREAVDKKHLRAAPVVGTKFYWEQDTDKKQQYVIGSYTGDGDCVIWHTTPEEDTTQYAKPRRRRVRVRFACGGRSDFTPETNASQKSVSKTNASKPASKKKSKKPASKTSDATKPAVKKKSKKTVSKKSVREEKHVVYNFHHPTSDENIKTCLTLPCNAYHAGMDCVVRVLSEHPNDKSMFILEGLGTKSKCHIRELTEDETSLDAVTSDPQTDTAEEQKKKTHKKSRKPTVQVKWKRCRAVSLSSMELATFNKVLQVLQSEEVLDSPPQEYEEFALRVCREYKGLQNSPLHLNSKKIVKAAIAQVFAQIRGKSSVPHGGDNASALAMLFPVVEKVYNSDLSMLTVIYQR